MQKMPIVGGDVATIRQHDVFTAHFADSHDLPVGESLAFLRAVLCAKQQFVSARYADLLLVVDAVVLRQLFRVEDNRFAALSDHRDRAFPHLYNFRLITSFKVGGLVSENEHRADAQAGGILSFGLGCVTRDQNAHRLLLLSYHAQIAQIVPNRRCHDLGFAPSVGYGEGALPPRHRLGKLLGERLCALVSRCACALVHPTDPIQDIETTHRLFCFD